MAELINKGALLADFNNSGIHIEFDLPVEEILGEDVDIDDFSMLVQDAIQAYRKMVIGTIQKQPTTTEAEIRAKIITAMSKAMKEYYPSCKGAYRDFDVFFHAVMAKVAEQLKEE